MHGWITERFGPVDRVKPGDHQTTNLVTWKAPFSTAPGGPPGGRGVAGPVREAIVRAEETASLARGAADLRRSSAGSAAGLTVQYYKATGTTRLFLTNTTPASPGGNRRRVSSLAGGRNGCGQRSGGEVFFLLELLWKSGASIIHGHAQATVAREMHYPLRRLYAGRWWPTGEIPVRYFADLGTRRTQWPGWPGNGDGQRICLFDASQEKEVFLLPRKPGRSFTKPPPG